MERAPVLLEEYRTLRQEALQAQQQQSTIIQFGIAGLTLLLGLGAQVKAHQAAAALLFVAVPLFTWLILVIWQGEVRRMRRAGRFLANLEADINDEIAGQKPGLRWETTLQQDKPPFRRLRGRYWAVFLLLTSIALVSVGVGIALVAAAHHVRQLQLWVPVSAAIVLGEWGWYAYELLSEREDRSTWLVHSKAREKERQDASTA